MVFMGNVIGENPALVINNFITEVQMVKSITLTTMHKISQYLANYILFIFYNSFVLSKLSYYVEVRGTAALTNTNKILLLHKKIVKIIYNLAPSKNSFRKINFL